MYSQQLLRINHDEWLRAAEDRRLINQARELGQPGRRVRPERSRFGALALRRRLRHA
jgi:hypothetical protein